MIVYHYKKLPPVAKPPVVSPIYEEFIEVDEVEAVDKENDIYNVHKVRKVKKKIDTHKLANSFKGFGVESIIQKFVLTGDPSVFGTVTGDTFTDLTNMPDNIHDYKKAIDKGNVAREKLEVFTGKKIDSISQADLDKAINDAVDKILAAKGLKKEDVKDE